MTSPIRWTEVRVLAPEEWHEVVAEALMIGPCNAVAFGRPSLATDAAPAGSDYVRTFVPDYADGPGLREQLARSIASLSERTGALELSGLEIVFRALPPEDYASSWKKSWKPFRVGNLCVVPPGWDANWRPRDRVLWLEPGGAFGSGRHATTRMCLRAIERRIAAGARVLDVGSGSGILGVAALFFGASTVVGLDVDPNARPYAEALARDNGVADRCDFRTASIADLDLGLDPFDTIVANIYSDVIQGEAAALASRLSHGGWFAFSGCPSQHAEPTMDAIRRAGLDIEEVMARGRWRTFIGCHAVEADERARAGACVG